MAIGASMGSAGIWYIWRDTWFIDSHRATWLVDNHRAIYCTMYMACLPSQGYMACGPSQGYMAKVLKVLSLNYICGIIERSGGIQTWTVVSSNVFVVRTPGFEPRNQWTSLLPQLGMLPMRHANLCTSTVLKVLITTVVLGFRLIFYVGCRTVTLICWLSFDTKYKNIKW